MRGSLPLIKEVGNAISKRKSREIAHANESQWNIFAAKKSIKKHVQWLPPNPLVAKYNSLSLFLSKFAMTHKFSIPFSLQQEDISTSLSVFPRSFNTTKDRTIDYFRRAFIFRMSFSITSREGHWFPTSSARSGIKKHGSSLRPHLPSIPFRRRFSNSINISCWKGTWGEDGLYLLLFQTKWLLLKYFLLLLLPHVFRQLNIFQAKKYSSFTPVSQTFDFLIVN